MSVSFNPILSTRLYNCLVICLAPGPFVFNTNVFNRRLAQVATDKGESPSDKELDHAGIVRLSEMFGAIYVTTKIDMQGKDYALLVNWAEKPRASGDDSWLQLRGITLLKKSDKNTYNAVYEWELDDDDIQTTRLVANGASNSRTSEMLKGLFERLDAEDCLDEETRTNLKFIARGVKLAGYIES